MADNHYLNFGELQVASDLAAFFRDEVAPRAGLDPEVFWPGVERLLAEFVPRNRQLLEVRADLQSKINAWHRSRRQAGEAHDPEAYQAMLEEIGYLRPKGPVFEVEVENVDPEIATVSGPQLVVPVSNARYALNAANARWVSLYDALYGTDVIPEGPGTERGTSYNPARGELVVDYVEGFLDRTAPLASGSYGDVTAYEVSAAAPHTLALRLRNGESTALADPGHLSGFRRAADGSLTAVLLRNHDLHLEIVIDPGNPVGAAHPAGVCDVIAESAITTIQDCEDSVAAVDAEDKVQVYGNWLGLMCGDLEDTFFKAGERMTRRLAPDRRYTGVDGAELTIPGRAVMLVRNVGLLMTNPAVLQADGSEIPEGILDAVMTAAIGKCDLDGVGSFRNSRTGSIYIVKPKLHGADETAFTVDLFGAVEELLGLAENTLKIGIMDEERRTTLNLFECVRVARKRAIFINTGFLDRTGDEIHTSMEAGPVVAKDEMKNAAWLAAYEDHNVDVGLRTGLHRSGQIGKGMWAMPDEMKAMVETKVGHPLAGANCAWVPSPTAAALHAMHYHRVDVALRQEELAGREMASLDALLTLPIRPSSEVTEAELQRELDNNAQGILGYVVRWVDHGVGCSKVPDINNVGLMEDRATCRISSQHIANWLHHGLTTEEQVTETFRRMAAVVDQQNAGDKDYRPMSDDLDSSVAFAAALELALRGARSPSGYTEPILHAKRLELKAG